jgi:predicted N-acetyltransferase YhbS
MTTALRLATEADAGRIAELHAESWRRTYRGMLRDDFLDGKVVENRLSVWRDRLGSPRPNQHVAVAESDGELDGFICAFGDEDPRWGTLIDNLHVRHRLHKSGIGRSLMREPPPGRSAGIRIMASTCG